MTNIRPVDNEVIIDLAGALWSILCREYSSDLRGFSDCQIPMPGLSQFAHVLEERSMKVAEEVVRAAIQIRTQEGDVEQREQMTVAAFVKGRFIPDYLARKRSSSRAFYKSILKHILRPEEVDWMFSFKRKISGDRLKAVPGWPYLSNVKLCDVGPDDIETLTSAALARGYSIQTVRHIRNVISAIFSHAKQEGCFLGDNPVSLVSPPEFHRKHPFNLTVAQAKEALSLMRYPEREITLLSVFTGMNLVEILGLQWKQLNLTDTEVNVEGRSLRPMSILVRYQLYRGKVETVPRIRTRNVQIPEPLRPILIELRKRQFFTRPDDFVLVSQLGTAINHSNISARRLRPIARQIGVPTVSCQAFRRMQKVLTREYGKESEAFIGVAGSSIAMPYAAPYQSGNPAA
jgi:integrase